MHFKFLIILLIAFVGKGYSQTQFVLTPNGHTARINKVIYNTTGDEVWTVSDDKSICLWNIEKEVPTKRYFAKLSSGNIGKIYASALSKDGSFIAFAGNAIVGKSDTSCIVIIHKKTEKEFYLPAHHAAITTLQFSHDGLYLASGSADSTIKVWKHNGNGKFTLHQSYALPKSVIDIDWAYDRPAIAAAVGDNNVYLMEVSQFSFTVNIKSVSRHFHAVRCVAFSPDSAILLSGADDFLINMYTSKGNFKKKLYRSNNPITDIAFSYDAQNIVLANETSGLIECINVAKGKSISKYADFDNTVQSLAFSPSSAKGNYQVAAVGGTHHELRIFSAINAKTLKVLSNVSESIFHLQFKDNNTLAFNTQHKEANLSKEIDFTNAIVRKAIGEKMEADFEHKNTAKYQVDAYHVRWNGFLIGDGDEAVNSRITCLRILNEQLLLGTDKGIAVYNTSGKKIRTLQGLPSTSRTMALSPDKRWFAAAGDDQKICIWKIDSLGIPKTYPSYSYYQELNGEWILWSNEGYFCGSPNADGFLGWQMENDSKIIAKINELDSYSDALYRPDLIISSFQNGNMLQALQLKKESNIDLQHLFRASPPTFKQPFSVAANTKRDLTEKSTDLFVTDTTEIILSIEIQYGGGGIEELNLLHNEKLLLIDKEFNLVNFKDKITKEYKVRLIPGLNTFKVFTINKRKGKSTGDVLEIDCKAASAPVSDLYVLVIGLNEYKNAKMNLNYGVPDAKAISDALKKGGKSIYNKINTYNLYNSEATLANIEAKIAEIKSQCKLTDMFVLYYAGHGMVYQEELSDESDFYMILHDVTTFSGVQIKERGLSSVALKNMLSAINANKQLVIMDACHSEAGFKNNGIGRRGLAEQQAIFQLARSSGSVFIASCGSDQTAKEFSDLGHGAFTYAFLEALNGKADGGRLDKKITVAEIKAYIEDRVPELTLKYAGTAQYPSSFSSGQDFPLGVVE